jgi:ATP-dependent Clp protease adaptor protein ClpS
MGTRQPGTGEDVAVKRRQKTARPQMYKVLLHNDDYTTMEFVVTVLKDVFNKNHRDAFRIMLNVHQNGIGLCGVYTNEVAETKVDAVHKRAQESGFPLRCSMEPE